MGTRIKDYGGDTPPAPHRFYATRRARASARADGYRAPEPDGANPNIEWQEPHPYAPLRKLPSGAPLREDGETHLEAWKRILRGDPCAFCGKPMFPCVYHHDDGATVDHIVPRSRGERYRERWTNFTGACISCNGSKSNHKLLIWMARRSRQPRFTP